MLTPSFVFVTTVLQLSASTAPERGSTTYPRESVAKCAWITGYQSRSLDGADNPTNKQTNLHPRASYDLRQNKRRAHTNRRRGKHDDHGTYRLRCWRTRSTCCLRLWWCLQTIRPNLCPPSRLEALGPGAWANTVKSEASRVC